MSRALCIALVLFCAVAQIVRFVLIYPGPLASPDTTTYLAWMSLVPVGYPAFLSTIAAASSLAAVPLVQLALYIAACLALFAALAGISLGGATLAAILVMSWPPSTGDHMALMPESLTTSLLVLNLAAVAWAIQRRGLVALFAIGLTIGLAVLVRPATYFLLLGAVAVVAFWPHGRLRGAIAIGCGLLITAGSGMIYSKITRGVASQELGGIALFMMVAPLYEPSLSSAPENIKAVVVNATAATREATTKANTLWERHKADWSKTGDINRMMHELAAIGVDKPPFGSLARDAIAAHPVEYAKQAAVNFAAAYAFYLLTPSLRMLEADLGEAFAAGEHTKRAYPYLNQYDLRADRAPLRNMDVLNFLVGPLLLLVGSAVVLVFAAFRAETRTISLVGLYALGAHIAGVAFASVTTVFIGRYADPLDVLALTALACAATALITLAALPPMRQAAP